jgi:hypothetical protein
MVGKMTDLPEEKKAIVTGGIFGIGSALSEARLKHGTFQKGYINDESYCS